VLRKFKELKFNYLLSYNPWLTLDSFLIERPVGKEKDQDIQDDEDDDNNNGVD
jgi:hypothetical protein